MLLIVSNPYDFMREHLDYAYTNKLMDAAAAAVKENGDNLSALTVQWGERQDDQDSASTKLMALGETITILTLLHIKRLVMRTLKGSLKKILKKRLRKFRQHSPEHSNKLTFKMQFFLHSL